MSNYSNQRQRNIRWGPVSPRVKQGFKRDIERAMSLDDIPRGTVLGVWDTVELEKVENKVTKENFEFVTSYNWLPRPDDDPTIVAPGKHRI